MFHLEFNMPYFAFRRSSQKTEPQSNAPLRRRATREWTDVAFLGPAATGDLMTCRCGIHEAQISVVLCGSDDARWVAYAFVDTDFSGVPTEEYEDNPELNEDLIASDGKGVGVDASTPIWNAREYFLRIVDLRMRQILEEWRYIVRMVERSVRERVG